MKIHVITLFPDLFPGPLGESIIGRALDSGVVELYLHNLRDHGEGPHKVVDDTAFGGGPGMVLKAGPLAAAIEEVRHEADEGSESESPVVLMDPQGERLTQQVVDRFAGLDEMIIISGRYEGIDERVRQRLVTHEISIGDYVLTGGELPAMVFIEAIARRVPGVLGGEDSGKADSFASGLLQHPQYTRPAVWEDEAVPEILLSGDHARVDRWRREQSLVRTLQRRPDLLETAELMEWEREFLREQGWDEFRRKPE